MREHIDLVKAHYKNDPDKVHFFEKALRVCAVLEENREEVYPFLIFKNLASRPPILLVAPRDV